MGISTAAAEKSNKSSKSGNMLAPGFRFHPTDEELVRYYLRRKVCGKGFRIDAISDIDIYKAEPWDLPSFSKLKTRDMEWYFFSVLDKKYGNGSKTNRATERGYWKTTGKDRAVYHRSQVVGMKKTLVYHNGRAPKGQRTNWVMHEYRLTDLDLDRAGIGQDAFVLCRVFQKSGSGPKNGERYGAPFVEEEWEDDELLLDPKNETAEIIDFDGDGYLDEHDLGQILGANNLPDASPLPSNTSHEDCSLGEVTTAHVNDPQNLLLNANKEACELQSINDENWTDFPASWDMDTRVVKHEFIGESSKSVNSELDFLLDEPFFDCNDLLYDSGFDAPNNSTLSMIDEYINFVNSTDSNVESFAFDQPSVPLEDHSTALLNPEVKPGDGNEQTSLFNEQSADNYNDSTPAAESDNLDSSSIHGSDLLSPFVKHSTSMLGNLPAPPAFASDLSLKDATALGLHSLYQASSSSHIAAGLIQIRDQTQQNHFFCKNQNTNIIVSLGFSRGDDGSTTIESSLRLYPGKILAAVSRSPFSFTFFLVMVLSIGFKLGTCIAAK